MFALIANVGLHPIQITASKTHHAVAGLPLECLVAEADLLVCLVGRGPFQLTHPIAYHDCWRNRDDQVNVRFDSAYLVDEDAFLINQSLFDVSMNQGFDGRC